MADSLPEHPPKVPIPMSDDRIWIDGCFDFTHHGHAGAMLQAKQLGKYLVVGVHTDEEILENKGPTVMNLKERMAAVTACKWTDLPVPGAPYVTSPEWMDLYGTHYVVHGDDVTTDSSGEDCYRIVKAAGRFKVVKRTPGISTTDLVGRMLLCTKTHHIRDLGKLLLDHTSEEGRELLERTKMYASNSFGVVGEGSTVYDFVTEQQGGKCVPVVSGIGPKAGQRVVYVDGGFDLFSSGHIEFLRKVIEREKEEGHKDIYVVAGVHDDQTINQWKGLNYPIMNMFERGLCVLQCRYINSVILTAPFSPTKGFLETLPTGVPSVVYHGPTTFMSGDEDPYEEAKEMGIFQEIGNHEFAGVNAGEIMGRILKQRELYEERQRRKGFRAEGEMQTVN
ncbi:Nucleotidylyl transferase [Tuber magnatum]|uniref:ethanolamine-phosphate cytidylyltransferase n=1 Tax=Tuber magnatum TaxID=42249 RepID=A0A317SW80_9PEZI|nr:Nucleotidylyl transferase [Tuber magnatum]